MGQWVFAVAALWVGIGLGACGPLNQRPPLPVGTDPTLQVVYASRCGTCHVPVEPGTRKAEELTKAFGRHRSRVKLTEEQWAQLTLALAKG